MAHSSAISNRLIPCGIPAGTCTTQEATWVALSKSVRRATTGNLASNCVSLEETSRVKGRFFFECAIRAHTHTCIYIHIYAVVSHSWCRSVSGQRPCSGEQGSCSEAGNDLETAGRGRLWAFHGLLSFYFLGNKYEAIKHRNKDHWTQVKLRLHSMIYCILNVGYILHIYYS